MTQRGAGGVPDISVIVPVYNTMPYLTACLDSLVGQSIGLGRLEVVAVDDGSTDGSEAELDRYAAAYPAVKVLHQPNSGGPARPCNAGLEVATGRYVFFLGSDDHLDPEACERMVEAADRWGSDVLIAKMVGTNGRFVNQRIFARDRESVEFPSEVLATSLSNTKLFRRSLVEEHGIRYALDLRHGSDQPFVIEAMRHARKISVLADRTYYYAVKREGQENITYTSTWRQRIDGIGSIMRHIADRLPEGPGRDAILWRHFNVELATLVRRDLGLVPAEEQAQLVEGLRQLCSAYLTDDIRARLVPLARLRFALVEDGDVPGLVKLHEIEEQALVPFSCDGGAPHQAPAPYVDRIREDRFAVHPLRMPGPFAAAVGEGQGHLEGSELVVEFPSALLPECAEVVRGLLVPAPDRTGWGQRRIGRVTSPPATSAPLDLTTPGVARCRIDLAGVDGAVPGSAWALRLELDTETTTWRLPARATLSGGSYRRRLRRTTVTPLPDPEGRLVFELHNAKERS